MVATPSAGSHVMDPMKNHHSVLHSVRHNPIGKNQGSPTAPSTYSRRTMKPLMERRRRARINDSLAELKGLLHELLKSHNLSQVKVEKADILELAVMYLRTVKSSGIGPHIGRTELLSTTPEKNGDGKSPYAKLSSKLSEAIVNSPIKQEHVVVNPTTTPDKSNQQQPSSSPIEPYIYGFDECAKQTELFLRHNFPGILASAPSTVQKQHSNAVLGLVKYLDERSTTLKRQMGVNHTCSALNSPPLAMRQFQYQHQQMQRNVANATLTPPLSPPHAQNASALAIMAQQLVASLSPENQTSLNFSQQQPQSVSMPSPLSASSPQTNSPVINPGSPSHSDVSDSSSNCWRPWM